MARSPRLGPDPALARSQRPGPDPFLVYGWNIGSHGVWRSLTEYGILAGTLGTRSHDGVWLEHH